MLCLNYIEVRNVLYSIHFQDRTNQDFMLRTNFYNLLETPFLKQDFEF